MYNRFFGARNPEKDVERLLVEAAGICRVIPLTIGWKIIAGTTTRFLQHSTAFQIDDGGNARGTAAVDLVTTRSNDSEVASGDQSFLGGGRQNTASGTRSAIIGGWKSGSPGIGSVVLGGYQNEANNDGAVAIGGGGVSHNDQQIVLGQYLNNVGDAQTSVYILSTQEVHASSSWRPLFSSSDQGINIPVDTIMTFRALVVGATQGCAKSFSFEIVGKVKNDGGTTTLDTSTITTIDDSDDVSFDCRAVADDTNDWLEIQVSDADGSGDTVNWSAGVETAEVTFPA